MGRTIWRYTLNVKEEKLWDRDDMQGWVRAFEGWVEDEAREQGSEAREPRDARPGQLGRRQGQDGIERKGHQERVGEDPQASSLSTDLETQRGGSTGSSTWGERRRGARPRAWPTYPSAM